MDQNKKLDKLLYAVDRVLDEAALLELSDVIGAIEAHLEKFFPGAVSKEK